MIFIAPPFGTWFRPTGSLPVLGSFTVLPRPGRTRQVLRTVRPVPGGWVNAIGLRNSGMQSVRYNKDVVYSFAGIDDGDWEKILEYLVALGSLRPRRIELNLSCPNVKEYGPPSRSTLEGFSQLNRSILTGGHRYSLSAKLPPDEHEATDLIHRCLDAGIRLIHLSNTLPSPIGGISGAVLRAVNLPLVEHMASLFPEAEIIAGGGIYREHHARQYIEARARHVSLGSVFSNPIRGYRLYHALMEQPAYRDIREAVA